jgi:hypothetical protein
MLPLDKQAALEMIMPELKEWATAKSTYRVTLERPPQAAYVRDSRAQTIMSALGEVLHVYSRELNHNLNTVTEARVVKLERGP